MQRSHQTPCDLLFLCIIYRALSKNIEMMKKVYFPKLIFEND